MIRVAPVPVTLLRGAVSQAADAGHHDMFKGTVPSGETVVWKHNQPGQKLVQRLCPKEGRRNDVREIVAFHIVADYFHLPTVTYREGYYTDDQGAQHLGNISNFQYNVHTLADRPVSAVRNPDTAVALAVVKGWLGDWDGAQNPSNMWLDGSDNALGGDYGWSIRDGVRVLTVPRANQVVMASFSRPDNVLPIVRQILSQSDDDIRAMVSAIGQKYISDWTPATGHELSNVLIRNRDRMARRNPFNDYYNGHNPFLHAPLDHLTERTGFRIEPILIASRDRWHAVVHHFRCRGCPQ